MNLPHAFPDPRAAAPPSAKPAESDELAPSPRLRMLNVAAVALSLAGATGTVFLAIFGGPGGASKDAILALVSALSTLPWALVWARVVRIRHRGSPVGWLLSVPLAALNAGTALSLFVLVSNHGNHIIADLLGALVIGATFGAFIWIPALIVTLCVFGLPMFLAQRAADRGLGSEDRGEARVGGISAIIGAAAVAIQLVVRFAADVNALVPLTMSLFAVVAGLSAFAVARKRLKRREAFLADVTAGAVPDLRMTSGATSNILVRVVPPEDAYRAAERTEALLEVDPRTGDVREIEARAR